MKTLVFIISLNLISLSFINNLPTDYLGVKGPINFNKTDFELKWSNKPSEKYYIQEYLPKNETLDSFNQMITISLLETDIKLEDAVMLKLAELEKRKQTDGACNYEVYESPDKSEFIVDFLLGEYKDDVTTIMEFNIYHYRKIKLRKKQYAIVLYAYSKRSYADDITEFFKTLKEDRKTHINEMASTTKPTIKIKKK